MLGVTPNQTSSGRPRQELSACLPSRSQERTEGGGCLSTCWARTMDGPCNALAV